MKKINKQLLNQPKAFTLIELLIVTTIIILMSASGIFYFLDFVKEQEISQKLSIIEDNIGELDKDVKNYNILDYELLFNTSNTGSKSYITYKNIFDSNKQKINLTNDNGIGTGTILTTPDNGSGTIKIFKDNKLFLAKTINRTNSFLFDFDETQNYKIMGTLSGEILNDIELNYFTEDNLHPENNNNLELININTKEDKTGTGYTKVEIINIGGNKKFYNSAIEIIINEIYLFFENNGKEKFIKITK